MLLPACAAAAPPPASPAPSPEGSTEGLLLTHLRSPGGAETELYLREGRLVSPEEASREVHRVDGGGAYVVPAAIDAHVHLAYLPIAEAHAAGGIAGAVDLASPISFLSEDAGPLRLRRSGPMVTAPGGYPTQSWGADGYGLPCEDPGSCRDAVERLADAGADPIKIPITAGPTLDDASLRAAVDAAHARGMRVATHALDEAAVRRGTAAGADILAHTPTAPLSDETVASLSDKTVISTLAAFGASEAAVDNLARLHGAGATVVYGTDLGNTHTAGIDRRELLLLVAAGLDEPAILDAITRVPATVFGFDALGTLEPGKAASFLLLDDDPLTNVLTLATPRQVYLDGRAL